MEKRMMYDKYNTVKFETLVGLTLTNIDDKGDELLFKTTDKRRFKMYHSQDCCESVSIEDICGDLDSLLGTPILFVEEVSSQEPDEDLIEKRQTTYMRALSKHQGDREDFYYYGPKPENNWKDESETWTFYKLSTINGSVTIRWYGASNGCYSESVDFVELKD